MGAPGHRQLTSEISGALGDAGLRPLGPLVSPRAAWGDRKGAAFGTLLVTYWKLLTTSSVSRDLQAPVTPPPAAPLSWVPPCASYSAPSGWGKMGTGWVLFCLWVRVSLCFGMRVPGLGASAWPGSAVESARTVSEQDSTSPVHLYTARVLARGTRTGRERGPLFSHPTGIHSLSLQFARLLRVREGIPTHFWLILAHSGSFRLILSHSGSFRLIPQPGSCRQVALSLGSQVQGLPGAQHIPIVQACCFLSLSKSKS